MIRVLLDMNLSPSWADFLRRHSIECAHWVDIGPADAPDNLLMQWALQNGRVIMTADLDFAALIATSKANAPSVLQLRSDLLTIEALGAAVLEVLTRFETELEAGAIVTLDQNRMRVRILPLDLSE